MKKLLFWLLVLISTIGYSQKRGDFIGTVKASDPDRGTVLTYTIIDGNHDNAFCFGPPKSLTRFLSPRKPDIDYTGQIYVNNPRAVRRYRSFILVIAVSDNGIAGDNTSITRTAEIVISLKSADKGFSIRPNSQL